MNAVPGAIVTVTAQAGVLVRPAFSLFLFFFFARRVWHLLLSWLLFVAVTAQAGVLVRPVFFFRARVLG